MAEAESTAEGSPSAGKDEVVTIIPADAGWRAIYAGEETGEESGLSRVVAWALVEGTDGTRRVVGMVVNPKKRTAIVAADESESGSGTLTGYGFKEI